MDLLSAVIVLVILVFSAILHEVAHGYVAEKLGDPTAKLLGRLTLNPIKHIDPFMSVLLPLVLIVSGSPIVFGAAKPVPVDPFNLKDGKKDLALVSLAGPLTNVAIAIISALIIKALFLFPASPEMFPVILILRLIVHLNLLLAIFNLIPIPPLDGSKILAMFLPDRQAAAYLSISSFGMIIIFALLLTPIGGFSLGEVIYNLLNLAEQLLGI